MDPFSSTVFRSISLLAFEPAGISPPGALLLLIVAIALAGAIAGVWMSGTPVLSRRLVPLSGALLVLVALVWVLPDLALHFGWAAGSAWMAGGLVLLWFIDRYVHPVCPACSGTHDHDACPTRLHGFATPLVIAATLHSFLDGWGVMAAYPDASGPLGAAVPVAIALHKIPEGLALGVILRAAMNSRLQALLWVAAVQATTLLGGLVESAAAARLGSRWFGTLLALTGGSFLYLGAHALHGELKRWYMADRHAGRETI